MIFGDAMAMREEMRHGRIAQKDVFSIGLQQTPPPPGMSLAMRPPAPVEIFVGFEGADYEDLQKRIAVLPSKHALDAYASLTRHPFLIEGGGDVVFETSFQVDPRHNPDPVDRPERASLKRRD